MFDSFRSSGEEKRCQEKKKGVRNRFLTFKLKFASLAGYGKIKASSSWWFDLTCA